MANVFFVISNMLWNHESGTTALFFQFFKYLFYYCNYSLKLCYEQKMFLPVVIYERFLRRWKICGCTDILIQNSVTVKEVTVKMRLVFKSKMYVNQGKRKEVTLQTWQNVNHQTKKEETQRKYWKFWKFLDNVPFLLS